MPQTILKFGLESINKKLTSRRGAIMLGKYYNIEKIVERILNSLRFSYNIIDLQNYNALILDLC